MKERLQQVLDELQLPLPCSAQTQLLGYIALLEKWNKAYNLTAVRDPGQMLYTHLADSLAVQPFIQGPDILDIGTGAGLPGIPLSIANPNWHFVLLDSNVKKARFVRQAALELGLSNVEVVHLRLEQYPAKEIFATVIARAFAPLPIMLKASLPYCAASGRVVAMLGAKTQLPDATQLDHFIVPVKVPGLQAQRHVLVVSKLPG